MRLLLTLVAAVVVSACAGSSTGTGGGGGSAGGGTAGGGTGGGGVGGGTGGGGGGTAGGAGGGTVDAGDPTCSGDGGASKCGCPGFTFCENFEGATVDTTRWTLDSDMGTAVIDATKSARGGKSLHVNIKSGAGDRALLTTSKPFPAANNSFFGRAFVFAKAPTPNVHTGIFAAIGGTTEVRLGLDHMGDIEPNYMSATNEYGVFTSNKSKMPTGVWSCLEWEYRGTGELHFFLNGTEMTQIEVLATEVPPWTAPTYSSFSLGMILFQNDSATATSFDVWFDEVAFNATRVGCAK